MIRMWSLYQTQLRHYINEHIYKKPTETIDNFQVIIKDKHRWPFHPKRWQILGIEFGLSDCDELKKSLRALHGYMSCQLWNTKIVWRANVSQTQILDDIAAQKKEIRKKMYHRWFVTSMVENMPEATVIIHTDQSLDILQKNLSSTHRRRIKKNPTQLEPIDIQKAYDMRYSTSTGQWFHIPAYQLFVDLVTYLRHTWSWELWWNQWAFALVLFVENQRYYLYGWSCVSGAAHGLHRAIIRHAHESWVQVYDMLWASPRWDRDHHLSWVTQFKTGFWWERIEYLWNFDFVYSHTLYKAYERYKNL